MFDFSDQQRLWVAMKTHYSTKGSLTNRIPIMAPVQMWF